MQSRPGPGPREQRLEVAAARRPLDRPRVQLGPWPGGRAVARAPRRIRCCPAPRPRGRAQPHEAGPGARVAGAAGLARVLLVAEVADEVQHPAAVRLGEARASASSCVLLVLALRARTARCQPAVAAAHASPSASTTRAAVDPELLERLLEAPRRPCASVAPRARRAARGSARERARRPARAPRARGSRARGRTRASAGRRRSGAGRARRACRRGRRGRSPGSSPRRCRAARCGRRCARRPCRCPCRRRWWRRSRRARPPRNAACTRSRSAAAMPGVVGGGAASRRRARSASASASLRVGRVDDRRPARRVREQLRATASRALARAAPRPPRSRGCRGGSRG